MLACVQTGADGCDLQRKPLTTEVPTRQPVASFKAIIEWQAFSCSDLHATQYHGCGFTSPDGFAADTGEQTGASFALKMPCVRAK